mmetsp:Transcript_17526/g.52963  ORF Transcript_17526/g.52963 Transcript_17526/m.52963 type:complete len:119 (+) Transcript_17526:1479-1835(+)
MASSAVVLLSFSFAAGVMPTSIFLLYLGSRSSRRVCEVRPPCFSPEHSPHAAPLQMPSIHFIVAIYLGMPVQLAIPPVMCLVILRLQLHPRALLITDSPFLCDISHSDTCLGHFIIFD